MKRLQITFILTMLLLMACNTKREKTDPKDSYTSLEQFSNDRIGVLMGSFQDHYITDKYSNAKILRINMAADLVPNLKSGGCDVIVLTEPRARHILKNNSWTRNIKCNIPPVDICVGFHKDDLALRDTFNVFLKQLKDSDILDDMKKRWFDNIESQTSLPIIHNLPQKGKEIVIGTAVDMPYAFMGKDGIIGFDIELVTRFAAYLGRVPVFKTMNFSNILPAMESKNIDLIASAMMITPERAKRILFSDPYLLEANMAIAKKPATISDQENITNNFFNTIDDLRNKTISVTMGTTHDRYVTKYFQEATIIRNETHADNLLSLLNGKCDATIFNMNTFRAMRREHDEIEVLDSNLFVDPTGFGFSYSNDPLKTQFNRFLSEIKQSGLLDTIINRWIWQSPSQIKMPAINVPNSGVPIRAGITGTSVPFTYNQNNQYVGADVEILKRFAAYAKRPIEFYSIHFGGLISALAAGKVDVIASTLTITPERIKQVNFSDPYYQNVGAMVVLKKNLAIESNAQNNKNAKDNNLIELFQQTAYSNLIAEERYKLILDGLWVTIKISVLAALLGSILGGIICFMRMNNNRFLNITASVYISILRGIPVLILLMLLFYAVFAKLAINAEIVAIIAFALNFSAYVSEMFRTSIQSISYGQTEAGIALGFTKFQTFIHIISPQALKNVLPVYKGELISLIKMTSVVGYIAVEDLTKASDIIRSRTFDAYFPLILVAVIYFLLAWIFTQLLELFNKKEKAQ